MSNQKENDISFDEAQFKKMTQTNGSDSKEIK